MSVGLRTALTAEHIQLTEQIHVDNLQSFRVGTPVTTISRNEGKYLGPLKILIRNI